MFIDTYEVSLFIKIEFYLVGMNIEIKKLQYILIKKIEVDINMYLENQVEVNQYISDI
jgi:hypothetical protein